MKEKETTLIAGIQQVGIGVKDAWNSFVWYNKNFKLDVPVFDDVAQAKLMTPHTNGVVRERRAILAMNMAGGGGAEIWQSNSPEPLAPKFKPQIGDLGIFSLKLKTTNVEKLADQMGFSTSFSPDGRRKMILEDNYENPIEVLPDTSWFKATKTLTGGVLGVTIGVSQMEKSLKLYKDVLGIDELVYDEEGVFDDYKDMPRGNERFRRVLLRKTNKGIGAFSKLLGNIEIELVQCLSTSVHTIFEGRSWGDLGYIHLCFDTLDMNILKERCKNAGFSFTVDSGETFDMGEAGGRFSYIQDPDGTLVEFVETHRVPIMKKLGWYINLKKRGVAKNLPNWMISTIGWGRVKL
ncbi:Catechol 2,3-dioxygenase [Spirosomataceae bacterium TFI 002]|nr:Catechol 2,3-dioxygenase [Spirosomataceae bacterium TFI 002]